MEGYLTPTAPLVQQETNNSETPQATTTPGSEPFLDNLAAATVSTELDPEQPAPPAAPEKLTRKQIGQLRRQYFTKVNGTVKACGHRARFSKDHDPTNNCIYCWAAYFVTSVDLDLIHAVLTQKGAKALVAMKGTKFVKMFHGFITSQLLPALAAETNNQPSENDEAPARITGGTFGNGNQSSEVPTVGIAE